MNQQQLVPHFIESGENRLFALKVPCNGTRAVLYIPPFAEEMNKSRKMAAVLLKQLANAGYQGYLFDFNGTGDSTGLFQDASWQSWQHDLLNMIESILADRQITQISVVACRTGALLLNDCIHVYQQHSGLQCIDDIHYWNPVFNPSQFVTQFLRLKLANAAMVGNGAKISVKDLRQQLEDDGTLEVAGYMLSAPLILGIEQATVMLPDAFQTTKICFYEISALGNLTPALQKIIQQFTEGGFDINAVSIKDSPFWSTQEITLSKQLLELTQENVLANGEVPDA